MPSTLLSKPPYTKTQLSNTKYLQLRSPKEHSAVFLTTRTKCALTISTGVSSKYHFLHQHQTPNCAYFRRSSGDNLQVHNFINCELHFESTFQKRTPFHTHSLPPHDYHCLRHWRRIPNDRTLHYLPLSCSSGCLLIR